jgi:hypothetical protein
MVRTNSGKGMYDDVHGSSTHHRGTFCPPVPPPSPLMPPVSLEQLLAQLNAIVQRLATADDVRQDVWNDINSLQSPPTLTSCNTPSRVHRDDRPAQT